MLLSKNLENITPFMSGHIPLILVSHTLVRIFAKGIYISSEVICMQRLLAFFTSTTIENNLRLIRRPLVSRDTKHISFVAVCRNAS